MTSTHITNRERDCLRLVGRGFTSKMTARELGLSPRTVETHLRNLKERLGIRTKSELIILISTLQAS